MAPPSADVAQALLAVAGIEPADDQERAALIGGYPACRAMAELLHAAPVGDLAPLPRPDVD